jgi:hypothetical protein
LLVDLIGKHVGSREALVTPNVRSSSDVDVDKVLQLLVKNVNPATPRIAEGFIIDVAIADEDVVGIAAH